MTEPALPANFPADALAVLPDIASAPFPVVYENAKAALTECSRVDECKDWANRMEALASYARQSQDDGLLKLSLRIQARAIKKCSDLLREIEPQHGANQNISGGAPTNVTRTQAAKDAGLSRDQRVAILRVGNVPEDQFEGLLESDDPPTVTALANLGKKTRPEAETTFGIPTADFKMATHVNADIRRLAETARSTDLASVVRGTLPYEIPQLMGDIERARLWLTTLEELFTLKKGA